MLSAAGKEFLDYAYDLQRCEAMALEHFAEGEEPSGEVSVGIMETLCASRYGIIFPGEFKKRYPKGKCEGRGGNDTGMYGTAWKGQAGSDLDR